jgi:hypothetical protein
MKPDNKLGHLEFEPNQAFDNLRTLARKVIAAPKKTTGKESGKRKTARK